MVAVTPPPPPSVTPLPPGIRAKAVDSQEEDDEWLGPDEWVGEGSAADWKSEGRQRNGTVPNPVETVISLLKGLWDSRDFKESTEADRRVFAEAAQNPILPNALLMDQYFGGTQFEDALRAETGQLDPSSVEGQLRGLPSLPEDLPHTELEPYDTLEEKFRALLHERGDDAVKKELRRLNFSLSERIEMLNKLDIPIPDKESGSYMDRYFHWDGTYTPPVDDPDYVAPPSEYVPRRDSEGWSPKEQSHYAEYAQAPPPPAYPALGEYTQGPSTLESGAMQEMIRRMFGGSVDQESKRKMNVRRQQYRTS
jgi:hypothetical protein